MKTRFIGDVHGKYKRYREIIRECDASIQVGDMGVGFYAYVGGELKALQNPPHYAMKQGDHRFIRGNHDNPSVCERQDFWIPDGTVHRGAFCVGGAGSIDRAYRTEGLDWWADEELSIAELDRIVDEYVSIKPEIVVSHDCPQSVANEYMMAMRREKMGIGERTRQALEVMLFHHQPRLWIFGHWHHTFRINRPPFKPGATGTVFQCLDELDWIDVEHGRVDGRIVVTVPDGLSYEA